MYLSQQTCELFEAAARLGTAYPQDGEQMPEAGPERFCPSSSPPFSPSFSPWTWASIREVRDSNSRKGISFPSCLSVRGGHDPVL